MTIPVVPTLTHTGAGASQLQLRVQSYLRLMASAMITCYQPELTQSV